MGGLRKPQLDGDLRRIRSGGELGTMYGIAMIYVHAINDETKKKNRVNSCESVCVLVAVN